MFFFKRLLSKITVIALVFCHLNACQKLSSASKLSEKNEDCSTAKNETPAAGTLVSCLAQVLNVNPTLRISTPLAVDCLSAFSLSESERRRVFEELIMQELEVENPASAQTNTTPVYAFADKEMYIHKSQEELSYLPWLIT